MQTQANHPEISIIIPCYNMGKLLLETLESVRKLHDEKIHEVIIINDGSSEPETLQIIKEIKDFRVINQQNGGLQNARNTGIKNAKGEYLLFLDADNLLMEGYLTEGLKTLQNKKEVDIVYGDSEKFGVETGPLGARPFNLQTLLSYNYIDACCLVRKKVFEDIGGFDEKMVVPGLADWEMWLRAAYHSKKFFYLENIVVQKYRVRPDSMIRVVSKKERDDAYDYLAKKFPDFLDFESISDFYFQKFNTHPTGWTVKLFLKKYFPGLFNKFVKKEKFSKYL